MTEEVKVEEQVKEPEVKKEETPELSPIELKATEMGWRPKEEFSGDEEDFIDAGEFVRRKPLFDKIEGTSKELKAVRKALEQFKQHYSQVEVSAYNRALADLKTKRREAERAGEYEVADQVEAQIEAVEKQAAEAKAKQAEPVVTDEPQYPQEFLEWKNQNRWYDSKKYMKVFADDLGVELKSQGLSNAEILKRVTKEVRTQFPTEFVNPKKATAPEVEASTRKGGGKSGDDGLDATERQMMETFVRSGIMTKEKYLEDLKAIKGQK